MEHLSGGAFGIAFIVAIIGLLLLWIGALIDILKSEFTGNNKIIWLLVVLFLTIFRAFLYEIIGVKQKIIRQQKDQA